MSESRRRYGSDQLRGRQSRKLTRAAKIVFSMSPQTVYQEVLRTSHPSRVKSPLSKRSFAKLTREIGHLWHEVMTTVGAQNHKVEGVLTYLTCAKIAALPTRLAPLIMTRGIRWLKQVEGTKHSGSQRCINPNLASVFQPMADSSLASRKVTQCA